MTVKNTLLSLGAIALLTGCGSSINLAKFKPSPLQKCENMPSKEKMMSNKLPKVIIMDIDNNNIDVANNAKLGKSIATSINTGLSSAKSVNVLKRIKTTSYDKMLSKEIKAAELAKEIGSDVGQADYLITGKLSTASYDYNFAEGYYYYVKTKQGTRRVYQPPVIRYKACSNGNIKIFSLPDLNQAESIAFDECSSTSHEARSPRDAKTRNDGLVRRSGEEAADTAQYPLKNFFAKKGYIFEMRKDGEDKIVKTTLGVKSGAKQGESVDIYAIENVFNPLTEQTSKETVKIGSGTISDKITATSSWIKIDEVQEGKSIKAGHFIKIKYAESIWSKGLKFLK